MPTPKGTVEVEYSRDSGGLKAEITLPSGLSGEIVWDGRKSGLHGGKQELTLR
jgi:hypothetical protein